MAKESVIVQENFDLLLAWLDGNREIAALKYEKTRERLIRVFIGRSCFEAEDLADETFNRVARKLPEIIDDYTGERALYFFAVADKIHLEWLRRQKKIKQLRLPETENEDKTCLEIEDECLEICLEKLPADQHRLILEYYQKEKSAKIENRRQLAESFGISVNALQVKASRIRARLNECLRNCVRGKSSV